MIEDKPVYQDDFVPNIPVRLLKRFKPTHTWVLEPGDMLYLPPRFPHHGVAQGDGCMTISVGFRAPSIAELINGVTNAALQGCDESIRYTDKDLIRQAPGEIAAHSLTMLRERVIAALAEERHFAEWFGSFITEPYDDVSFAETSLRVTKKQLISLVKKEGRLTRVEGARFAYVQVKGKKVLFFVNGEPHELDGMRAKLGRLVADSFSITSAQLTPFLNDEGAVEMLRDLLKKGVLVVEEVV
jgi:50S ribosomal protein L16 3-hydroxylase